MVRLNETFLLLVLITLISGAYPDINIVGGFIFYRVKDDSVQYLLLKKADRDDWSPPKGNTDDNELALEAAIRETSEETGYDVDEDYDVHVKHKVFFQYETSSGTVKKVYLWPAKLTNLGKKIELISPENSKYEWLGFDNALDRIKKQYRDALKEGDVIIQGFH